MKKIEKNKFWEIFIYITKNKNLTESKLRYSGNIGIVEIPLIDSFQVDTYEDLELIRKINDN